MTQAQEIAALMVWLRGLSGMSRPAFARRVGVTRQSVWEWENTGTCPTLASFLRVCDAIGVAPAVALARLDADEEE